MPARFKRSVLPGFVVVLITSLTIQDARSQSKPLTSFSFLRLEPSARAAALAGSFSAVYGDDINALFYNPALLNEQMQGMLSLSYLNHLSDVNAGFVAYGRQIEGVGMLAAGIRYMGYGDFQETDAEGNETGSFGASEMALTVAGAHQYSDHIQFGVGLHYIHSGIDRYSASALAADVGVLFHLPDKQFTLSASVNNLGFTMNSLGDTDDQLPLDIRIGATKRLTHLPLFLSVTAYNLDEPGDTPLEAGAINTALQHLVLGGEFQFSDAFNIRFGYNHRRHEALKTKSRLDLAGFSTGFGLKVSRIRFDYAFSTWSSAGGLHQFTLRTKV